MVGDVKQSIYKFRGACPELFLQKYNNLIEYVPNNSPHSHYSIHYYPYNIHTYLSKNSQYYKYNISDGQH